MKKGEKMSTEQRQKLSAAKIGKKYGPPSPKTRAKISAALMGKTHSPKRHANLAALSTVHGHTRGGRASRTYESWCAMWKRCTNPKSTSYKYYGARDISICWQWREFAVFLDDMGERPKGTTLDRIDVNGNYEPGNCRWATNLEQRHNRRP